jgi:hypothetical protein
MSAVRSLIGASIKLDFYAAVLPPALGRFIGGERVFGSQTEGGNTRRIDAFAGKVGFYNVGPEFRDAHIVA